MSNTVSSCAGLQLELSHGTTLWTTLHNRVSRGGASSVERRAGLNNNSLDKTSVRQEDGFCVGLNFLLS